MRSLSLLLLALAAPVHAEDLKAVAVKHEADFRKAMLAKDYGWFERVAAPDFWEMDYPGHKLDRKQALAQIKAGIGSVKVTKMENQVTKVQPKGTGYVALVENHMVMQMGGGQGQKPAVVDSHMRYEETWSKDGGAWKMRSLKTLKDDSTLNGKPMKSMKP